MITYVMTGDLFWAGVRSRNRLKRTDPEDKTAASHFPF